MTPEPILLVGGSGMVGRWAAKFLREAHADVKILMGGRDLAKAQEVAADIGNAEGVEVDMGAPELGLGDRSVSAVALFFADPSLATLRYAQARGLPHIGISSALHAIGPEVAAFVHKPTSSAIVLGTEWLVGAATVPALNIAKDFGRIDEIYIGALIDEQDTGGPEQSLDYDRAMASRPSVLTRRDGGYFWRAGDDVQGSFRSADGTEMQANGMSLVDVVALATETGASNVHLDLAVGVSSTRRRGEAMSTEIIIEMAGEDHAAKPLRTRHAVVYPGGQLPLTGFGVAMLIERLTGLDGKPKTSPGLYFPYQLLDHAAYLTRLEKTGGQILDLGAQ
jgi:hypothetical protein